MSGFAGALNFMADCCPAGSGKARSVFTRPALRDRLYCSVHILAHFDFLACMGGQGNLEREQRLRLFRGDHLFHCSSLYHAFRESSFLVQPRLRN